MMNYYLLLVVLMCSLVRGAHAEDLAAKLDALETSMTEAREQSDRTESSLESVRRELYEAALKARELKLTGDEMLKAGKSAEFSEDTIERIRQFMMLSAQELRGLRDRVDALDEIVKLQGDSVASQEDSFRQLKEGVEAIERRGPPQKARQEEFDALNAQLADANAKLGEQESTIRQLNEEIVTLRNTVAAPKVSVVSLEEEVSPAEDPLRTAAEALAAGDYDAAGKAYNEALSIDNESVEALLGLSSCAFETGNLEAARQRVDEVLDLESRNARALGLRGAIKYREGNYASARRDLERAIRYDASNPNNYNYLGVVLQQMDKYPEAIENVSRAIELDPDYASAYYNLAVLLATAEAPDMAAARDQYDRYLELGGKPSPELEGIIESTAP